MKKKILIALFSALLLCIFALTVSAANEVTLTDGTQADLATVFKVSTNKNGEVQITGFQSGYDKNMVTDVTFPDEIDGIESNYLFSSAENVKTITFAATDTFFISGDGVFSSCSVEKITFNPDCVVELRKGNFSSCKSLTEITFPKFKKLAGSAFKNCSSMVATNELIFAEGMTEIGGHAFNGCTSLTGTVYFPSTLEKIQEYSFQNTGFTYFDLSKCANLSLVGGGYGGPFTDCDNITSCDLSACVNLKVIEKGNLFAGCENLEEVILPPNLTNLPEKAFSNCPKLQSLVLPASCTKIGVEAFQYARKDQELQTFTLYIQSNVVFDMSKYSTFSSSSARVEFVLIGEGVTAESFIAANTYTHVTGATVVDYKDSYNYTPGGTIAAHTIVENYCASLALNGEHKNEGNACVVYCPDCLLSAAKENPEHNLAVSISYENGYLSVGKKLTACQNAGCTHSEQTEASPLFNSLGYSIAEEGASGVDIGYRVNRTALGEYEDATGKTVSFGIFATLADTVGKNDIFDANGEALAGVVSADMTNTEYSIFRVKMVGFDEEQKAISFVMGAYVCATQNGEAEYAYLQIAAPSAGEKYFYATYNEILELKNKKN